MLDSPATRFIYFHGFASGPESVKARVFRRAFADVGWQLEVPDLNPPEFRRLTLGGMVERVEALTTACECDLVLAGSSLGGYLATRMAARLPRVRGVVAMAPAFDIRARWIEYLGEDAIEEWRRSGVVSMFHHGYQEDRLLEYGFFEEAARHPAFPEVGAIPMIIFHGRYDDVVPLAAVESFVSSHPHVLLRVFDDDHALHESIDAIVREATDFLSRCLARPLSEEVSRG